MKFNTAPELGTFRGSRQRPRHSATLPLCHFATLLFATAAHAQDLTIKAPAQSAPIAIVNATVHPVSGPAIEGGHVVFDQGRIIAVGGGPYTLSGPGTVIDATGKHVWPGMIGAVTQIGLTEIQAVRATADFREISRVSPEVYAAVAVNPDSTIIPVTRANGVLAAGVFPNGGLIPGRASVVRLEGWTWEEMTVEADAGLVVNWPVMRTVQAWWMDQSEEDQQRRTRESMQGLDTAFDTAAAYAAARDADPNHPADLRWEAVRGVMPGERQRPTFIFAQDVDQITAAVTWAADRKLKPVIVGGQDAALCSDLLKKHNVPVVVVGTHTFPKRADSEYDGAYTLPARLEEAGILWCLASSDDTAHERNLPYNAAIAVAHGLDHDAAIRGVTLSTAKVLGVEQELGSLDTGKSATLFIADGSPLEVTTKIERAFIDGRAIDLSSKHAKLAEKYREKYRQSGEVKRTP
ncbi:MAG: amidohydrolase family protein [Phycisphaerales bacterium]